MTAASLPPNPRKKSRIVGWSLALVAVLGAISACSPVRLVNALTPTSAFKRTTGLPYVASSDAAPAAAVHPRQRLDVYQPADPGFTRSRQPVIVFFYGGAWQEGDRGDYLFLAEALTQRGFVVVVPDYRVYPEVRYPEFLNDGAAALAWTQAHIADYGGDPQKMFVMGHSAGAHIAAMLTLDSKYLAAQKLQPSVIRGFVGLAGPYDFLPLTEPNVIALFASEPDLALTQPIHYVAQRPASTLPPILLLHGSDDTRVYPKNSINLAAALRQAGANVEFDLLPGLSHVAIMAKFTRVLRGDGKLPDRVEQFVRRHAR